MPMVTLDIFIFLNTTTFIKPQPALLILASDYYTQNIEKDGLMVKVDHLRLQTHPQDTTKRLTFILY